MSYRIIVTSAFGLESVVVRELKQLGYDELLVKNGRISFEGGAADIARCNIWLRSADRVLIEMGCFKATDYDELFRGVQSVYWEHTIPFDGKMHVTGKSVHSKLISTRDCQSITKRAIVNAMRRKYFVEHLPETGPTYKIEVAILKDEVSLTIDTTGDGLHKRGYRLDKGEAPLRETLAAGIVLLSRWSHAYTLVDPCCGSGTIAIEAALIGRNIAPGLQRKFISETWSQIPQDIWYTERQKAIAQVDNTPFRILASDVDPAVLRKARDNAERAGVADWISFQKNPLADFRSRKKYGYVICNPPYGERMGFTDKVEQLYKSMGKTFASLDTWSVFVLTAHPDFQKHFGKKAHRNRKLYNGKLQCYLYEYAGPRPPRPHAGEA